MSYYNQQQPPVGVPPPQGYPPEGYPKDAYPPPGYPPQGYPPQPYPAQGYPPPYAPQYAQPPPQQQSSSKGCLEGWFVTSISNYLYNTCRIFWACSFISGFLRCNFLPAHGF
ncbi:hypothetical protein HS088_TW18G00544 [Tripterygium wilfordii]|uniref:Cysteine-rich and transmembrane domain-containing protein A-like n=1 Tax=Tripterygium wilfordii TaxID=458696 RepID=A0A7J7CCK2_TRIWF|nr:hypothetical protein HS088_TW18G00544 [Tripterygium wilfordii]